MLDMANMESTSKITIGSALAVAAILCVGFRAHADSWADAVSRCAPGAKLDDCIAALKQSGLAPDVSTTAGHRHATVALRAATSSLKLDSNEKHPKTAGRITQAQFFFPDVGAKDRHALVAWLSEQMKGAKSGVATENGSGLHCGAESSGPGWSADGVDDPEVQLALTGVPWLKPPSAKSPSALFEKSKADGVRVCFMLPLNDRNTDYEQPKFSSVFAEFVKAPQFTDKTQPAAK
jgi:hypothetical protein